MHRPCAGVRRRVIWPQEIGMAVTVALAREMALELEGASEAPHFSRIAFRTPP